MQFVNAGLLAGSVSVMQFNIENLFDPYDDPDTRDEDFMPEGKEHWTLDVLDWKIKNLATVITSVVNPDGTHCPDILVVEEIENAWVGKRLKDGPLRDCGYKKIIIDSKTPDMRGIRNAVFTKLDLAREPLSHFVYQGGRNILEVPVQINGKEFTVFANHWKSRIPRAPETDFGAKKRAEAAQVIRSRIQKIFEEDANRDLMVVGDLNDEPEDDSLFKVLSVTGGLRKSAPNDPTAIFWEPSAEFLNNPLYQDLDDADKNAVFRKKRGTYLYRGRFYQLDHILLSRGFFDDDGFSYQKNSFEVIRHPLMTNPSTQSPIRFQVRLDDDGNDRGPKGASDHFPILVRLNYSE